MFLYPFFDVLRAFGVEGTDRVIGSETPKKSKLLIKSVLTAELAALGIIFSYLNPFAYFTIFGTKINPFAHLFNAIAGVLLGPVYAVLMATIIAVIRYSVGIGSIYAFPGGIPGALVVGLAALLFKKPEKRCYAALFEPIGTVFIGGTISSYMSYTLGFLPNVPLIVMWGLFAASCIVGAVMGFIITVLLNKKGINYLKYL